MQLFKTRASNKLRFFLNKEVEAESEESELVDGRDYFSSEKLLQMASEKLRMAKNAEPDYLAMSYRISAGFYERWADRGGFRDCWGQFLSLEIQELDGDEEFQKLKKEIVIREREQWKAQMRKYGHKNCTILTWEYTDLEWLLELQSLNNMPDMIQVYQKETETLERISGDELIRRLKELIALGFKKGDMRFM